MCKYLVAAAIALLLVILSASAASAQVDPTNSFAFMPAAGQMMVCPAGDGGTLAGISNVINIQVFDVTGLPMSNLVFNDFEVDGVPSVPFADGYLAPGTHDLTAFGFANMGNGIYQLTGSFIAGGYAPQAIVKVLGVTLGGGPLNLILNSPDITGDGNINLSDVGFMAQAIVGPYDWRLDFNGDGTINLSDAGLMALHIGHTFPGAYVGDPVD